jgi:hypothetical protein
LSLELESRPKSCQIRCMSDDTKPTFDKGDRAAIVNGPKDLGVRGSVFWVGENKYGPGMRFGLRGDDGATYWVDESQIGREEDAPPAPEKPAPTQKSAPAGPTFDRGDSVKITGWAGASKYGEGMRYGVRVGEETYWADGHQVEAAAGGAAPDPGGASADRDGDAPPAGMFDDIPAEAQPPEGELPPEAFDGDDMPAEAFEDDIPF